MARFKAFASDDEDDDASSVSSYHQTPQKPSHQPALPPLAITSTSSSSSSAGDDDEDGAEFSEDDSVMDERELLDTVYRKDEKNGKENVPWPQQLNLEPQRMHVMQTSLFRMPELANAQQLQVPGQLKHPRSPDVAIEPKTFPQRQSFAQPRIQPPSRKYIRVAAATSISKTHEGAFIDAGLSFGRSFRVGWGPGGRLVHLGGLSKPTDSANSSMLNITTIQLSNPDTSSSPDLLSHLLANTPIMEASMDTNGTPCVSPNRTLTFSSFLPLFSSMDNSHAASLFRLGQALFDPLNLHLGPTISADLRHRVLSLRRADALSSWLTRAVAPQVEQDLKNSSSADSARTAFLHLTGNQIEKAVEALTDGGNHRLATLIAQAPGDDEFRADVGEQLRIWREEKIDAFVAVDVKRVYALAAGIVDVLEGSGRKEDVEIAKGLDWLRVLGLQLWFANYLDTPLQGMFEAYERLVRESEGQAAPPIPWYSKASGSSELHVTDGLFSLMKLAFSPSMTLESTLVPLSFGPNPRDYRLPWFIYVLLSRCMRVRDFTDREAIDSGSENTSELESGRDGYSATADSLTTSFAAQLEQGGLIQETIFVLLFLEDEAGRKRTIKEVLARSAPLLDEWNVAGIHGSLKIPQEWIDEAKATHAFDEGHVYRAYELYTQAGVHKVAHELAITYLAPEAILRNDLELLRSLFDVLDKTKIPDWSVGGQLFIDYANIITRVPELRNQHHELDAVADASELEELDSLTTRVPRLIGILPDVLHDKPGAEGKCNAALSTMLANLLDCLDTSRPMKVEILPGLVDEAARLRHVHATAYGSFLKSIASVA